MVQVKLWIIHQTDCWQSAHGVEQDTDVGQQYKTGNNHYKIECNSRGNIVDARMIRLTPVAVDSHFPSHDNNPPLATIPHMTTIHHWPIIIALRISRRMSSVQCPGVIYAILCIFNRPTAMNTLCDRNCFRVKK